MDRKFLERGQDVQPWINFSTLNASFVSNVVSSSMLGILTDVSSYTANTLPALIGQLASCISGRNSCLACIAWPFWWPRKHTDTEDVYRCSIWPGAHTCQSAEALSSIMLASRQAPWFLPLSGLFWDSLPGRVPGLFSCPRSFGGRMISCPVDQHNEHKGSSCQRLCLMDRDAH